MKYKIGLLAATALATGNACAQSSVTLYGLIVATGLIAALPLVWPVLDLRPDVEPAFIVGKLSCIRAATAN
ncbi:hypothetical protein AU476_16960 [Cupriavidus sp. UYMSc13B]|nr:hypothetical protein AU476_16960 [Cupriavidus sp. UYMSc13B]